MNYIKITLFFLHIFVAGCLAPQTYTGSDSGSDIGSNTGSNIESDSGSEAFARDHLQRAAALENSRKYHEAAIAYAQVAEQYPSTSFYKTAVLKTAHMNIHPENSNVDNNAALHWLKVYLTLDLPLEERENTEISIFLLERISSLETDLSSYEVENKTLRLAEKKQSSKLTTDTHRVKQLEEELKKAQIQLEEMKEVDLRMHMRRVNGGDGKPVIQGKTKPGNRPGDNIPETPATGQYKSHQFKNATNQTVGAPPLKEKQSLTDSGKTDTHKKNRGRYPYTIQVSSFTEKEFSILEAEKFINRIGTGYTSRATIQGNGDWYRVFVGQHRTLEEAKRNVLELQASGYPDAFAAKMPFSIRIEPPSSVEDQNKITAYLRSKGYLPYTISDGIDKGNGLFIGAFETRENAEKHAGLLKMEGFKPRVVRR